MKSLSALLRGITSNHDGDFYCLNCFHSNRTGKKLKKHERVCNDHDYCHVEMPDEDNKILKYNYGDTSLKDPLWFMLTWSVYLKKFTHVKIILKNLLRRKKLGIRLLVIHCLQIFRLMRQKVSLYGKDCMEKFCKDLRGHAVKIISYEKKEIILLTNEENEYY